MRRVATLALAITALLAVATPPSSADDPFPRVWANDCSDFTLRLAPDDRGALRLQEPGDQECTFLQVAGAMTAPEPSRSRLETRVLVQDDERDDVATLCSISNPLVAGSVFETVLVDRDGSTLTIEGDATYRFTGAALEVHFVWTIPGTGGHAVGTALLEGSSCGVGAEWTGNLFVYDPEVPR